MEVPDAGTGEVGDAAETGGKLGGEVNEVTDEFGEVTVEDGEVTDEVGDTTGFTVWDVLPVSWLPWGLFLLPFFFPAYEGII